MNPTDLSQYNEQMRLGSSDDHTICWLLVIWIMDPRFSDRWESPTLR